MTESKKPPKVETFPLVRAMAPSAISKNPARNIKTPPREKCPIAKKILAIHVTASPEMVYVLGLIRLGKSLTTYLSSLPLNLALSI